MVRGCLTKTFELLVLPLGDYTDQRVRALEAGIAFA